MSASDRWRLNLLAAGVVWVAAAAPVTLLAQDAGDAQPAAAAQDGADKTERPRRGRGQRGGGGPVQTVEQMREQVNALNLKDDQKTRLDAIFKEAAQQAQSLQTEVQSMERRERAQKLQPFNRDLREKVAGILDENQRQTLRRNAATRQGQQMAERWKRVLGQLNLTSDQQTKADTIIADAQKKLESQAAEAGAGDGAGRRGGGGVTRETRQKIQEMLTPHQQQKLAEMMPEGGRGGGRRRNAQNQQ